MSIQNTTTEFGLKAQKDSWASSVKIKEELFLSKWEGGWLREKNEGRERGS